MDSAPYAAKEDLLRASWHLRHLLCVPDFKLQQRCLYFRCTMIALHQMSWDLSKTVRKPIDIGPKELRGGKW